MSEDKDIANCHCDKLYFELAESALFLAVDLQSWKYDNEKKQISD